jgi:hypothetical protein
MKTLGQCCSISNAVSKDNMTSMFGFRAQKPRALSRKSRCPAFLASLAVSNHPHHLLAPIPSIIVSSFISS